EINADLVRSISEESNSNSSDEILIPKLLEHENTIAQQNNLIKDLQEHISELEQLLEEACKDTNVGNNNNTSELLEEIQKLNKKMSVTEKENLKNKQMIETLRNTFNENDIDLQNTKEELDSVLIQKQELLKYINELKTV